MAHPDVYEAAVVGVPDARWEERPLVVVVPGRGSRPTAERAARLPLGPGGPLVAARALGLRRRDPQDLGRASSTRRSCGPGYAEGDARGRRPSTSRRRRLSAWTDDDLRRARRPARGIAEELADLAFDRLRRATDRGPRAERRGEERRITRARRAEEKRRLTPGPPGGGEGGDRPAPGGRRRTASTRDTFSRRLVEGVDQLPQPGVVDPVEAQGHPGQLEVVVARALGREGLGGPDRARRHDVGEAPVELGQLGPAGGDLQPEHQEVADPPARVVVAVEAEDLGGRLVDRVGHA